MASTSYQAEQDRSPQNDSIGKAGQEDKSIIIQFCSQEPNEQSQEAEITGEIIDNGRRSCHQTSFQKLPSLGKAFDKAGLRKRVCKFCRKQIGSVQIERMFAYTRICPNMLDSTRQTI